MEDDKSQRESQLNVLSKNVRYCAGRWLPSDQAILDQYIQKQIVKLEERASPEPLHPVVQDFKDAIDNSAELTMIFSQMFAETSAKHERSSSPQLKVRNYQHMLQIINSLLLQAPEFIADDTFVGLPMTAVVYKLSKTVDGFVAFLNPSVNFHLKNILNAWAKFLVSPSSCYVLTTDGWFSEKCLERREF